MQFTGTEAYVATDDLKMAVNASITLQRPLLIKGEPGTGKTLLAEQVAQSLGLKLIQWHVKSTTKAQQGLYEYDAVSRLRDSQLGDSRVFDIKNYIKKVYETGETIKTKHRPIIIITSNNEKDLPDAFLRRCFFHYIVFPDVETMKKIVAVHYPHTKNQLVKDALDIFFDIRKVTGLKKRPSTSELIDWLKLLMSDEMPDDVLRNRDARSAIPPLHGALLKNEQDVHLLERLAFMTRRS